MGLETGESVSDSIDAELFIDSTTSSTIITTNTSEHDPLEEYLKFESEFCDSPRDIMNAEYLIDAAQECSNDPSCDQFYETKKKIEKKYSYYRCYETSKLFFDDGATTYRRKCNGDEDCGSGNICKSGQCYKFRPNEYCSGNRFEGTPFPDIENASKVCSQNDYCRCMQDNACSGNEIFLYSSTQEGSKTDEKTSCALVKTGVHYDDGENRSGKSLVNPLLLIALIICSSAIKI